MNKYNQFPSLFFRESQSRTDSRKRLAIIGCTFCAVILTSIVWARGEMTSDLNPPLFSSAPLRTINDVKTVDTWYGMYCDGTGCKLSKIKFGIKRGSCSGGDSIDWVRLSVKNGKLPVFAIKGFGISATSVETYYHTFPRARYYPRPDEKPMFGKLRPSSGKSTVERLLPAGKNTWVRWAPKYANNEIRFYIEKDDKRQLLYAVPVGNVAFINPPSWIGDLDRDGRMDFFIEYPAAYGGYDYALYISNIAKNDEIVGLASRYSPSEQACD